MKIQYNRFTLAILCILLIYLVFSVSNLTTVFADDKSNGSSIAGVNVNGLDSKEIEKVLNEAVNEWISEDLIVSGGGVELLVDPSKLEFDIPATIAEYRTLTDKSWYAFWESERVVHIPLKVADRGDIQSEISAVATWETDETYNQVMSQASFLMGHEIEATVSNLDIYNNERIALSIREIPTNAFGLDNLVTLLDGTMVNPGEEFSFINTVNESATKANSDAINFVSSLLYDAILQTEFEITERHQGNVIPTNLELGKEVAINIHLNEDLKFRNNTDTVGKIHATVENNSLKVEITSSKKETEVYVSVDKEILSPRIVYRYSKDLPIGYEQVIQEGSEGYRVLVSRTISGNGRTEEQLVSRDYYPPVNQIVLKSSKSPEQTGTNSDPTNTTDPNLEIDMDGDGLPDIEVPNDNYDVESAPEYDKGGNITSFSKGIPLLYIVS
ncbi:VanW family protein [Ureibacillus acetophenoni]|uniref:Vancomycin resistance protein YoaR n=1 Tax=Ureibacillus acetophenoni TaxID=614649 RepID=A0A285U8L8_9BACL|nr:VanW family protein [Ureibacillus acetophenoni]SOC38274.1 vancomycin resistance protein YoaR [Ureibacillus acetophenoni]